MNKKGSTSDVIGVLAVGLILSILIMVGASFWGSIKSGVPDITLPNGGNAKGDVDRLISSYDYLFVAFILGMNIVAVILAFFIKTHPIFAGIGILIWIMAIFLSGMMANLYDDMNNSAGFSAVQSGHQMMTFIWQHIARITLGFLVLIGLALYAGIRVG